MENNWRNTQVVWQGGMAFSGANTAGGTVQIGSLEGKPGLSPMELLLIGLGGCTGMDVVMILEKKRKNLTEFKVDVRGRRAENDPRVYEEIVVEYHLWGTDLDESSVTQAIRLSEEKYCSASAMLGAVANIKTQYFIYNS
jgi:putative redox protein